jgi:hypothetical protein
MKPFRRLTDGGRCRGLQEDGEAGAGVARPAGCILWRTPFDETLAGIHEGNFARYRIRPSQFEEWQAAWNLGITDGNHG